jgi:type IV secretory pathway TrbD component
MKLLDRLIGRLWKRTALYALIVAMVITSGLLTTGLTWGIWVWVAVTSGIWMWDVLYTWASSCSCYHQYRDHPDPKYCDKCDRYCDYDGRVPSL